MTKIWTPNKKEMKKIRAFATQEAGQPIFLEVGKRVNLHTGNISTNIAIITDDPDWEDTDLYECVDGSYFEKGVELNKDGKAIIDFYLYSNPDEELISNLTVTYENDQIISIVGTRNGEMIA